MNSTLNDVFATIILLAIPFTVSIATLYLIHPLFAPFLLQYILIFEVMAFPIVFGLVAAGVFRILNSIHPLLPGKHSQDTPMFRWYKIMVIIFWTGSQSLAIFCPLFFRGLVYSLFGAKIGKNVSFMGSMSAPWLVEIGNNCMIGTGTYVDAGHLDVIEGSFVLTLRSIKIGDQVTVGANAVIMSGVEIGNNALVGTNAVIQPDKKIEANEKYAAPASRKTL